MSQNGKLPTVGKKRTRTGCLNCRRKRRKCDETKPTCEWCSARQETCEWGIKLTFRPENATTVDSEHPSMQQARPRGHSQSFKIVNVTSEVIRDYHGESVEEHGVTPLPTGQKGSHNGSSRQQDASRSPTWLGRSPPARHYMSEPGSVSDIVSGLFVSPGNSDSAFEDGIFLPGSQYQELHAALRNAIHDTARSTCPSIPGTPEPEHPDLDLLGNGKISTDQAMGSEDEESRRLAHLSEEKECTLWQNYIQEVAGWLDKFDIKRHFELELPILAKSHPHLKYSILALSARQLERKERRLDYSCSLALYQHAIHLLSPLLQTRTTVVLASCVVLCVLEMLSCAPKAWRRHLDGCAALIQALGITGASRGLQSALFWVFARMDICGGLISSERTLIPMYKWMGGGDIEMDVAMFFGSFDVYANHMVYLCGRVIEFLCTSGKWEQRHQRSTIRDVVDYVQEWTHLFELVEHWYANRPEAMKTLFYVPARLQDAQKPFATTLFGSGTAISGNQLYHTAALLMLKHKPARVEFVHKPQSLLWHARQICAISISNGHHGAWTNSTQPLWIAGQHMSHQSEHRAILDVYERIESETGWATRWRANDLLEFWGEEAF